MGMGMALPQEAGASTLPRAGEVSETWKCAVKGDNEPWFSTLPTLSNHPESFKAAPPPQRCAFTALPAAWAPAAETSGVICLSEPPTGRRRALVTVGTLNAREEL